MTAKKKKILSDAEVEGGLKVGGTLNIPIQNGLLATNNSGDVTADASIDLDELHTLDGIDKTQTIQTQLTDLGTRITNLNDAAVHKAGTETITGAKTFTADTVMSGNVTVGAAGDPSKDLHVLGNADVDGYLNVDGAFATPHITDAGGNNDNVQIRGSVTVSKNATIGTVNNGNSLTVNGNETLNGVLDVPTIKNSRTVSNVDQPLTLDDDVTITSGKILKVSNIIGTASDELNINTPVNVTGDLSTTTDVIAGRDLTVTRDASVTGVLSAPTLHTKNISDPDDDVVEVDDTLNVNGNLNVVGASSDLSVGRNASITGALYTDTIASKTENDPVNVNDNLTVTGTTTSTGLVTANNGLTVNGASTLNGNISQGAATGRTASLQDTTVKSLNITGSTANAILRTDGSKNVSATAIDDTVDKVLTTGSGNTLTWQLPTTTSSPTKNSNAVASVGSVYLEKTRAETAEGALSDRVGTLESETVNDGGTYLTKTGRTLDHDATSRDSTSDTSVLTNGGTVTFIDSLTSNQTGHVTASNTKQVTLPKVTAGTGITITDDDLPSPATGKQIIVGHTNSIQSGTVGSATQVAQVVYDAQGHVKSGTQNVSIAIPTSQVTSLGGYSVQSGYSALGTSDTLNVALGKLEKALTDGSVTKVGKTTVGGTVKPIYLNNGTPAVLGSVGASAKPVYLDQGEIKASTSSIGNATTPVYLSSGTITAGTALHDAAYLDKVTTIPTSGQTTDNDVPTTNAVKQFVNSSIGTATANFLGTYTALEYRLEPAYLTFTSTSDYVNYYVVYNDTYTLVTASNKDSLNITAGTTKAYSHPADSLGFTQAQVDDMTDPYSTESGAIATELGQIISNPSPNDYVFVEMDFTDPATSPDEYRRYKFDGSVWQYEYTLNNSSFTQAQWDAINSTINSTLVTGYSAHVGDSSIHVTTSDKSAWNAKYDKPSGGIPSTDMTSAVQTSLGLADSAIQSVYTINGNTIVGSGNVNLQTPLTFDTTPTADSANPVTSGGVKTALDLKIGSVNQTSAAGYVSNIEIDGTDKTKLNVTRTAMPTIGSANFKVQANSTDVSTFSANATSAVNLNIKQAGATTVTAGTNEITISSTDTKNTAGSTDTSSKIYLIGATSQAANPQTYSQDTAYVDTDGCLYSGGTKVLTAHQSLAAYVQGPGSATGNNVALFDGTTGKLIKDSGKTLGASIPAPTASQDEGKAIIVNSTGTGFEFGEAGKVDDIKVNNTSIVSSKIANLQTGVGLTSASSYTILSYIQSTGTQYINTGIAVDNHNSFVLDVASSGADGFLLSQGNNSIRISGNNATWYSYNHRYPATLSVGTRYLIECGYNFMKVDGADVTAENDSDSASGTYVYLFAKNDGTSLGLATIYGFKIYDSNDNLVFDGVPAKRGSDNAIGLYDKVSQTFKTNSGTGTFTAGTESTAIGATVKAKLSSESSIGTIGNNKVYAVGVDSNGYLSVNVPWTDTTYPITVNDIAITEVD